MTPTLQSLLGTTAASSVLLGKAFMPFGNLCCLLVNATRTTDKTKEGDERLSLLLYISSVVEAYLNNFFSWFILRKSGKKIFIVSWQRRACYDALLYLTVRRPTVNKTSIPNPSARSAHT
jgi:hypothetical protein